MKKILPTLLTLLTLVACSRKITPADSANQKPANDPTDKSAFAEKRAAGVDFYALGTEPFWSFEIDYEDAMRFTLADGETLRAPVGLGQVKEGALTYESPAGSKNGRLRIVIKKEACSDGMSDRQYDYAVQITAKDKTYKGCGIVLAASPTAYWILEKINGKSVTTADYHDGLPVLQLNFKDSNYGGSDGCNSLRGALKRGDGNALTFADPVSTKMACPGNAWQQYIPALRSVTTYTIEKNRLVLSAGKKEVLVFRMF